MTGERGLLLIVRDDHARGRDPDRLLPERGWGTCLATAVGEALGLLVRGVEPDCIVLLMSRPDGGGAAVLRRVREAGLSTRVAICTGPATVEALEALRALGPDLMLIGPIDADAVDEAARQACGRSGPHGAGRRTHHLQPEEGIMDRRELLGVLGAGAAGLAAAGGSMARADHEHEHDEPIKTIGHCAKVCNEAAHHCLGALKRGGPHAEHHARSQEAAMDCQAFCVLTAALMARSSPMAAHAHRACADACRDCASACEGHQSEIMKECVEACRECEKVCRRMGGSAGDRPGGTR